MKKLLSVLLGVVLMTVAIFAIVSLTAKPVIAPGGGGGQQSIWCTDEDINLGSYEQIFSSNYAYGTFQNGYLAVLQDTCIEGVDLLGFHYVEEAVCKFDSSQNGYYVSSTTRQCPFGSTCSNGACTQPSCIDYDGGININVGSFVKEGAYSTFYDNCADSTSVNEQICDSNGLHDEVIQACPIGKTCVYDDIGAYCE
ncbi:MAG: hypothetical protein WC867_04525 [Candidatus Pacearchaeota archaeon]|jgi:hypothetical protein